MCIRDSTEPTQNVLKYCLDGDNARQVKVIRVDVSKEKIDRAQQSKLLLNYSMHGLNLCMMVIWMMNHSLLIWSVPLALSNFAGSRSYVPSRRLQQLNKPLVRSSSN